MIIFKAGVFSGHILVNTIISSELYCCYMIIFCGLVKIMIVQDTRYKIQEFIHQFWAQQGHTKMMHMKEEKFKR